MHLNRLAKPYFVKYKYTGKIGACQALFGKQLHGLRTL
jgi:hypothetical protein